MLTAKKKSQGTIWVLIILFGTIYSFYSVVRHLRFGSFIFDLGVYDQIIWLASRGKPLFSSILESHPWGDHFTPTLLFLAPLYWVWDNVITLLIFQAFFTAFGAYPIYLLAKKRLKNEILALTIAFAYLGFYGIQNAIAFDFHPITLATTLFAWLFWLYEERRYKFFWSIFLLFLGLQENFLLLAFALGIFLVLRYQDYQRGIIISVASLVLFVFLTLVIIPTLNQAPFIYLPTHLKTLTPAKAVEMLFSPNTKIQVIIVTFLAFGFLPIFSPAIWVLLLEEFFQRFVGTPISTRWNLGFQYNAILAPIVAFGAIEVIKVHLLKKRWLAVTLILFGMLSIQILIKPSLNDLLQKKFYDFSETKSAKEVLASLPPDASVATTNNLGPQITHRQKIIFLTNCLDNPTTWKVDVKRCFHLKPDYLVADMNPEGNWNNWYPDSREEISNYLSSVQKSGQYSLVKRVDSVVLLKRNLP